MAAKPTVIDVLMSPSPVMLRDNPFLALLYANAAQCDMRISPFSRSMLLLRRHDIVHIHWPEWHIRWRTMPAAAFDIVTFLGLLWLARRRGAAIVWTGHNLEPHEVCRPRMWKLFQRLFISQLDLLISFGMGATSLLIGKYPQLVQVPVSIVPHVHYRSHYAAAADGDAFRTDLGLDQRPVLLHFGLIRPYKDIPGLIHAWKQWPIPRPQIVVAGRPLTPGLEMAIRRAAGDAKDVHLLFHFIEDDEVPTIFAAADIVVMPYSARCALNSGVAHLAMSLGKPAVLNDTPANRDLRDAFGSDWVWLCDGTPADALRVAMRAAVAPRPDAPDVTGLSPERLGAMTRHAYLEAIAARRFRRRFPRVLCGRFAAPDRSTAPQRRQH